MNTATPIASIANILDETDERKTYNSKSYTFTTKSKSDIDLPSPGLPYSKSLNLDVLPPLPS